MVPAAATPCHSSPSSATRAISSPTLQVTFSRVRILARVPSSVASMDMTALSVWMSQITSPSAIVSPAAWSKLKDLEL